jgi:hypothetical protein
VLAGWLIGALWLAICLVVYDHGRARGRAPVRSGSPPR